YEGAGYQSKGVYRPVVDCRMRVNEVEDFCPVCQRAITRMIRFYTEQTH
ncbi:MAG: peptidase M64, partial [Bacteroidaceae bacterium]|nr:peptidase M64 [Bacteroidaceae bacterium]